MHKLMRERRAFISRAGLSLEHVEMRGKHIAFVCSEGTIICGCTPSDRRERQNFRSRVKRLAR